MIIGAGSLSYSDDVFKRLHLVFTSPRIDSVGYNKFMTSRETWFKNKSNNPRQVMNDSMQCIRYNYHPMSLPYKWEDLKEIKYNEILPAYIERFGNPADFNFYLIGNFDKDSLRIIVSEYIASLPTSGSKETFKDIGMNYTNTSISKTIELPMVMPKAKANIEFHGSIDFCLENTVYIEAIAGILDRRFTETVREDEGGTYGVSTYGYVNDVPYEHYNYYINFECAPERVDELKAIIYEELDKLKAGDIDQKYIDDYKTNYTKTRDEDLKDNFNWLLAMLDYDENGDWFKYCKAMDEKVKNLNIKEIQTFSRIIFTDSSKIDVVFLPEVTE